MNKLTTYEAAWLIGGPGRAALVTFVTLATDGRLDVADKRQRVKVARAESTYPIEAAALALIPESGIGVGELLVRLAASGAMKDLEAAVRAKGQLRALRWFSATYRELLEDPGTGVRRVAVLGVPGIEEERLRDMLEHPLPGMPKIDPFKPVRDNTIDGTIEPTSGSGYI
ncbi:TIGR04222 domain-containing membrane protein [Kribbella speibonae]|uniref:TIGR04222 domain-containing membrane protein n=1 Tax=Kribbella speibonae TaxID=1572660 RepID=A0A4V2M5U6_9ACTN|nr:TIGR04222 domain-containing membrane protein [Kribbella speibonae]TCC40912.1 TIGR04222 domain-containing membrane protein [Kribbella speibonae]